MSSESKREIKEIVWEQFIANETILREKEKIRERSERLKLGEGLRLKEIQQAERVEKIKVDLILERIREEEEKLEKRQRWLGSQEFRDRETECEISAFEAEAKEEAEYERIHKLLLKYALEYRHSSCFTEEFIKEAREARFMERVEAETIEADRNKITDNENVVAQM